MSVRTCLSTFFCKTSRQLHHNFPSSGSAIFAELFVFAFLPASQLFVFAFVFAFVLFLFFDHFFQKQKKNKKYTKMTIDSLDMSFMAGRKYASGQNSMNSALCVATYTNGKPCMKPKAHLNVPYCESCMKTGDPSLGVVKHPRFGKMLVARRDLPAKYSIIRNKRYDTE